MAVHDEKTVARYLAELVINTASKYSKRNIFYWWIREARIRRPATDEFGAMLAENLTEYNPSYMLLAK